jgi:hypothetical protein
MDEAFLMFLLCLYNWTRFHSNSVTNAQQNWGMSLTGLVHCSQRTQIQREAFDYFYTLDQVWPFCFYAEEWRQSEGGHICARDIISSRIGLGGATLQITSVYG